MLRTFYVTKASGKKEKFDPKKLIRTCKRAGATKEMTDKILDTIYEKAYNGIPTRKILDITLTMLHKKHPHVAARYNLKKGIMNLGPAGFLFEKFMAEVLKEHGFQTSVHNLLKGACVKHEVDIVASRKVKVIDDFHHPHLRWFMIECKFHNAPGIYSGVKDVLYTYARFEDLVDAWKTGSSQKFDYPWLITNTKFSRDAKQYASCKNMRLLGWKYPAGKSLEVMIEEKKLYPITILSSLTQNELEKLSQKRMMLCKDLFKRPVKSLSKITGISLKRLNELIIESEKVLGDNNGKSG